jgi:hypothetical protein
MIVYKFCHYCQLFVGRHLVFPLAREYVMLGWLFSLHVALAHLISMLTANDTVAVLVLLYFFYRKTIIGQKPLFNIEIGGSCKGGVDSYGASSVSKMLFYFKIRFSFSYNAINFG